MNSGPLIRPTSAEQIRQLREHPTECTAAYLQRCSRKERRRLGDVARRARISMEELVTGHKPGGNGLASDAAGELQPTGALPATG